MVAYKPYIKVNNTFGISKLVFSILFYNLYLYKNMRQHY